MNEKCQDNCPLTSRVEALERANEQHGKTHREIFGRLNAVEQTNAVQNANYVTIIQKLDDLTNSHKELNKRLGELEAKPGKRWESLVGYVLAAIAGAFVIWAASGMPGVGG